MKKKKKQQQDNLPCTIFGVGESSQLRWYELFFNGSWLGQEVLHWYVYRWGDFYIFVYSSPFDSGKFDVN